MGRGGERSRAWCGRFGGADVQGCSCIGGPSETACDINAGMADGTYGGIIRERNRPWT